MHSLQVPLILDRLSPGARSWMISKAATERVDPQTVAIASIEELAKRDGFGPPPDAPATAQPTHPKAA